MLTKRKNAVVALVVCLATLVVAGGRTNFFGVLGTEVDRPTVGDEVGFAQTSWMLLWGTDAEVDRDLDAMAATGGKWLRLDFDWQSAEPSPGNYRWTYIDRVVNRAQARGLRILATPAYTPAWARPAGTSDKHPPTDPKAYAAFVKAAAQRYGPRGVHHWEIWNEPNIPLFWQPLPNPAQYAALLRASSAAIRSVDRQAVIVTAGLAPAADTSDGRHISPRTFLSKLYQAGVQDSFDAVGMHPYAWPYGISAPGDWNQWYSLSKTYDLMVANGDSAKKIWATEYGAPTGTNSRSVTEAGQATFVQEAFSAWPTMPWAGPLFWYSFRDQGNDRSDPEDNFGIMRRDFSAKPAMSAFAKAMAVPTATAPAPAPTPTPT
ncbi:MAG TPA: cellulase family glycosylhydrolase, partial [Acidimicrobiales bacterium]|nr:cellulase family glycosylhydrolase [Acidimicrobiales bacterium]